MSHKYALFVGNSEYDSESLCNLASPIADVRDLANVFRDSTIGGFDEVKELINTTESKIRQEISSFFLQKKPDDLLLLYFSGHGVLDDRGHLYLAVKDTKPDLLRATAISADFIADDMDLCRSKRQILILDCCHSGAFRRGIKGGDKALTAATFEGNGSGRIVLTASDRREFAMEGNQVLEQAQTSLFTHFLLEGIKSGKADRDGDSLITLDEWYDYAYEKVVDNLPTQTPRRWVYNQEGRLIIARNPNPVRSVELPNVLLKSLQDQRSSVRLGAVTELRHIIASKDKRAVFVAREELVNMLKDESSEVREAASEILADYDSGSVAELSDSQLLEERLFSLSSKPDIQQVQTGAKPDTASGWGSVWSLITNSTARIGMVATTMVGVILIGWILLPLPDQNALENKTSGSPAEQAEMGTSGVLGNLPVDSGSQGDSQEASRSPGQQGLDIQEGNVQEGSASSSVDDPARDQGTTPKQESITQEQEPPGGNQQSGVEEHIPSETDAEEKEQSPELSNKQNAAFTEEESGEEIAATTENLSLERLRTEMTDLQNVLRKAILDQEWDGVPAPLADYYGKMLDRFYNKFNVVGVESKAGDLLTDEATATLIVAIEINYRQKGREDMNTLQIPAVNWVWIKRDEGYVFSYVQEP